MKMDIGMACQKLCKQGRDDSNERRSAYEYIHPYIFFTHVHMHSSGDSFCNKLNIIMRL